jgi:drug/metabolite transporter (DMT)-like permease
VSRRAVILFAALSIIWGIPYLLIKISVSEVTPAFVVFARTAIGAVIVIPIAAAHGAIGPALRAWRWVLAFAAIEIGGAWLLLGYAETHVSSSLAGLLVAMVPLISVLVTRLLGDRAAFGGRRLAGLGVGLVGVAAVVGLNLTDGGAPSGWAIAALFVVAVFYATAPVIASRKLAEVPSLGVIAVSLGAVALAYAPAGIAQAPSRWPTANVTASLVGLGVVCTAIAFLCFFALIADVGPVRATLITYLNPAVAILAGWLVRGEQITVGMAVGLPLVLVGSYLATIRGRGKHPEAEPIPTGIAALDEAGATTTAQS